MSWAERYDVETKAFDARRREAKSAVFGKARLDSCDPAARIGLSHAGANGANFQARRTDTDRRPARTVTRLAKDGPAPDREARAAALLAAVAKKAASCVPKNERRDVIMRTLVDGPKTAKQLGDHLGFSPSSISDITAIASKHGLLLKSRPMGNGSEALISLTDEGRAYLAGVE